MNYHDKTKDQIIEELLKMQSDYNILKKSSSKEIAGLKQPENRAKKTKTLQADYNKLLINMLEEERAMIAMNLHDDIGQRLTALSLNIAWLKSRIGVQSKVVKEKLEEINLMIKETIDGVQDFSSNLRPAILFDLGPASAFISFLKKFENQSGIKCHFYNESHGFQIENNISIVFYRILQEALTNIARHSKAKTAEVTLRKLKNKIEFIIKDNGIGIEIARARSHRSIGITGIKKRAALVNGRVLIKGERDLGTTILITVPVLNAKAND